MRLAVFTPSHDIRYLDACYRSLAEQTHRDWEWIVALNGRAAPWHPPERDDRVRVLRVPGRLSGVGAVKRYVCEQADADILVELDHDDVLLPDCLAEVAGAFAAHPDAALVYSDFAQIDADGSPNLDRFDPAAGWVYSDEQVGDITYLRCHALAPTPHNVAYIWYAPNHVRAFRRGAYEKAGGYDAERKVLDDQALMMRLYAAGEFVHVPKLLYLQRVHAKNTQRDAKTNAFIQSETVVLYDGHVRDMTAAWAQRAGLAQLRVRTTTTAAAEDLDPAEQDVAIDAGAPRLAAPDDSVGLITLVDLLPHVADRAALFNECHRVLAHGGLIVTQTASTDGRGAFQDPLQVSFWNENSFWYLTQEPLRAASLPALTGRWQVSRLHSGFPSPWHQQWNVPYVYANLIAVKDGPRNGGALLC